MPQILSDLATQVLPFLFGSGGLIFYIMARKERKASIAVTEASALQEMQKSYAQYVIDNNAVIDELKKDLTDVKQQLADCIKKCKDCPKK